MTHAHICDECKTVVPLDEHLGWWEVRAGVTSVGSLLAMDEKDEYHFCGWPCLHAFTSRRMARIAADTTEGTG